MRSVFLIIIAAMSFGSLKAQTEHGATDGHIITGVLTFGMLEADAGCAWFPEGVAAYTPDTSKIKELTRLLPEFDLVVFMGTWCSDSQRLIPQFYKTLLETGYPLDQVVLYGLDMSKRSEDGVHDTHKIEWVPTIIVKQYGSEVGRITETVQESVEADLAVICRQ